MNYDITNERPRAGLEEFVEEFYIDRSHEIRTVNEHLDRLEFEEIRSMAHKWKGFSAPYGFQGLAILSKELEEASKNKQLSETEDLVSEIVHYLNDKGRQLKKRNHVKFKKNNQGN